MSEFSVQVLNQGVATVVDVRGDVDLSVAGELAHALEPLLVAGARVVLDCSGVAFFDSMALQVAILARSQAQKVGAAFAIVPSDRVVHVLELAGMGNEIFSLHPDVTDAVASMCN